MQTEEGRCRGTRMAGSGRLLRLGESRPGVCCQTGSLSRRFGCQLGIWAVVSKKRLRTLDQGSRRPWRSKERDQETPDGTYVRLISCLWPGGAGVVRMRRPNVRRGGEQRTVEGGEAADL